MSWPASEMERHLLGATLQRAVDQDLARAIDCSGAYRDIYFAGYSLSHRTLGDSRSTARKIFEAKVAGKAQECAMKRVLLLTVGILAVCLFGGASAHDLDGRYADSSRPGSRPPWSRSPGHMPSTSLRRLLITCCSTSSSVLAWSRAESRFSSRYSVIRKASSITLTISS
jgi:hypothetical protein